MTTPEPQPDAPPPQFQFTLRTLLLLFVVLGSSLAVFRAWGIVVFGLVVELAVCFLPPGQFTAGRSAEDLQIDSCTGKSDCVSFRGGTPEDAHIRSVR